MISELWLSSSQIVIGIVRPHAEASVVPTPRYIMERAVQRLDGVTVLHDQHVLPRLVVRCAVWVMHHLDSTDAHDLLAQIVRELPITADERHITEHLPLNLDQRIQSLVE